MATDRRDPPPGRLFFGAFTAHQELWDWVRRRLGDTFGPLDPDGESPVYRFPETRAYSRSMGSPLWRKFFFLRTPVPQDSLASVKRRAIRLEEEARGLKAWSVARPINIDPGLLNDCRIILASTRDCSHRLYRGDGIWEEVTLLFQHGAFRSLPWTYPDFRAPDYHEFFTSMRARHLRFLAALREGGGDGEAGNDAHGEERAAAST